MPALFASTPPCAYQVLRPPEVFLYSKHFAIGEPTIHKPDYPQA